MKSKNQIEWEDKLEAREFPYDEACRKAETRGEQIEALIAFIEQRVIFQHWASSDLNDVLCYTLRRIYSHNLPVEFYPLTFYVLDNFNKYNFPRLEIYKGSFNDGIPMFKAKDEHRRLFKDGFEVFESDEKKVVS